MSTGEVLLDVLVVLVAAKLAGEVAERAAVPTVAAEIVAGLLIGPSVLGWVAGDEVLRVLGELGAIILLLEVGLQTEVSELGRVGRRATAVAGVGVALPLAGGLAVALAMGEPFRIALFLGAALTATSVGVTARVFGDLRALATVEGRTVLGAAVADDVLGLVLLTVVVRIVAEGSVSLVVVGSVVAIALIFLVAATASGLALAPVAFRFVRRMSRSAGTLLAIALAFTLATAELARLAGLAPLVGAFIAGLALARTNQADRIRRDLTPVGHLFVPVFFLQIGIDVDAAVLARSGVLTLAAGLLVVGVVGKVAAGWAAGKGADRLLVGIGMLPRGEVGLIFAGLGLRSGVLDGGRYAALLLVILVTTIAAPPMLRLRLTALRRPARGGSAGPPGAYDIESVGGEVVLSGAPPRHRALGAALRAATLAADARPTPQLLDWLRSCAEGSPLQWDKEASAAFFTLLREGTSRSWRLLEITGVLERALPELADALHRRGADPFELDPAGVHRFELVERTHELIATEAGVGHPEWLILAALILDVGDENGLPVATARRLVKRLDLGATAEEEVALLVGESRLLTAAARRPDGLDERAVVALSAHLEDPERACALYLLSLALDVLEPWERARLDELHSLVQEVLRHPELSGRDARNLAERRRAQATGLTTGAAADRIATAPRGLLLSVEPDVMALQAELLGPPPPPKSVRVSVRASANGSWHVDVAARDQPGLLAAITGALFEAGLDVQRAVAGTWDDGAVVDSFAVNAASPPEPAELAVRIEGSMKQPGTSAPMPAVNLTFDDEASPWYTLCAVDAPDRLGLLHAIALAVSASGGSVHSAQIDTRAGLAHDRFELTDRRGAKLDGATKKAILDAVHRGVDPSQRKRLSRRFIFGSGS